MQKSEKILHFFAFLWFVFTGLKSKLGFAEQLTNDEVDGFALGFAC